MFVLDIITAIAHADFIGHFTELLSRLNYVISAKKFGIVLRRFWNYYYFSTNGIILVYFKSRLL